MTQISHRALLGVCVVSLLIAGSGTAVAAPRAGSPARTPTTASTASIGSAAVQPTLAPPAGTVSATDWPTYHGNIYRTGYSDTVAAVHTVPSKVGNLTLDGAVYASPIVVDNGIRIVATENDTVYRILDNKVVWSRHLGTPAPVSSLPCGDINPLGITGTPAFDAQSDTVVVVAELADPVRHVAYGIAPSTGAVRWSRSADVPSESGIDPAAMQQRGALMVGHGHVYVPYGGLAGDCGSYRGSVVGIDIYNPTTAPIWHYTVPTSREAGIWAPAGVAWSPRSGLLVAVGNGATAATGTYDHSDSVLRIGDSGLIDSFSPSTWRQDNAQDLDLGSTGATVVGDKIFIVGKRGTAYVLNGAGYGGIGGQLSSMQLCTSFGGTAVQGNVVFVPCTDGLRAVQINSNGTMRVLWHTAGTVTGSPVIGAGWIWAMDGGGVLHILSPTTGLLARSLSVGATSRFATPALSGHEVLIGTMTGVVSYTWSA